MKNQYFGDNKDLFTYDLIWQVMRGGLVKHFSFVPMLTADDSQGHGAGYRRDKAKAGIKNKELVSFLDKCIREDRRDIKQLEGFFRDKGFRMTIYRDDSYFSHAGRREYFEKVGDKLLASSLIFLDPDIGLEVKVLYQRMSNDSILMVYQYLPRVPRQDYLNRRCTELKEKVSGDFPVCIDDNEIAFFFLTKDESLEKELTHVIGEYADGYGG